MTSGQAGLDLDRLAEIRRRVEIPLVLHGGTGIAADALRGDRARAWPRSTTAPISSGGTSTRCGPRSASTLPTRTGCWVSAGRRMSWSPAVGRSAMPCSNGSISSDAAERPYNLWPSVSCACGYSATAEGSLMDVVMRMPDVATVDDTVTLVGWLVEVGRRSAAAIRCWRSRPTRRSWWSSRPSRGRSTRSRSRPAPRWPPASRSRRLTPPRRVGGGRRDARHPTSHAAADRGAAGVAPGAAGWRRRPARAGIHDAASGTPFVLRAQPRGDGRPAATAGPKPADRIAYAASS